MAATGSANKPAMPVTVALIIPAAVHNVVATMVIIERIVSLSIFLRDSGVCVFEVTIGFIDGLLSIDAGIEVVIVFTSNNVFRDMLAKI
ncbi:uncharacterized protein CHPS25_0412 [Chlamydia psittaci]|nr:hypothetical protein G5O_0426 [Chlamydia psittaci 6BC]ATQ71432.1 uncharacterized protein CHPS25_0412 [Chlamydia psittaci]ATQ72458.1 uncharacterized protein CHPS23_0413 [Chlamydia psittaci]ATQ79701.1 uncharacterized protein CHPS1_0413 [Chlamydia psittaci]